MTNQLPYPVTSVQGKRDVITFINEIWTFTLVNSSTVITSRLMYLP